MVQSLAMWSKKAANPYTESETRRNRIHRAILPKPSAFYLRVGISSLLRQMSLNLNRQVRASQARAETRTIHDISCPRNVVGATPLNDASSKTYKRIPLSTRQYVT